MPGLAAYDNALLTAHRLDDGDRTATGALYDGAGQLLPDSVRRPDRAERYTLADPGRVARPSPVVGKYNYPDGYDMYLDEAIFAGHAVAGWGHTITETISTAWAADRLPDVPIVLAPWGRLWVSALSRVREVLDLAGWGRRPVVLASGSVVFGRVHVPERLFPLDPIMHEGHPIDDAMNAVYDRMVARSRGAVLGATQAPVFLARPEGHRRAHPFEGAVEAALAERGVRVVRGWELSVREQIAIMDAASSLVGFTGSGLHNSVFARRGVPVVEIQDARAQANRGAGRIGLQSPLCVLRDQEHAVVDGFRGDEARSVAEVVPEVADALAGHLRAVR